MNAALVQFTEAKRYYKSVKLSAVIVSLRLVPGVLFSNYKIGDEKPAIADVAPTMLTLFGLQIPTHIDGKPWAVASGTAQ